jgi:hypothetical protein
MEQLFLLQTMQELPLPLSICFHSISWLLKAVMDLRSLITQLHQKESSGVWCATAKPCHYLFFNCIISINYFAKRYHLRREESC